MIDRVTMKGKWVITTEQLHQQALDQFHNNHMDIEKPRLLS